MGSLVGQPTRGWAHAPLFLLHCKRSKGVVSSDLTCSQIIKCTSSQMLSGPPRKKAAEISVQVDYISIYRVGMCLLS